jgi:acetyl esterase/lipase
MRNFLFKLMVLALGVSSFGVVIYGASAKKQKKEKGDDLDGVPPTFANMSYGSDAVQTMNIWKVPSSHPTGMIIQFHGNGFVGGGSNKKTLPESYLEKLKNVGISYASVNYLAPSETISTLTMLKSCARAVQFIRYKSGELNIDKTKVALTGSSAGGNISTWISVRDDFADPSNADPILRESTRVAAVWAIVPSATLDVYQWPKYIDFMDKETLMKTLTERYKLSGDPEAPETKPCVTKLILRHGLPKMIRQLLS